MDSSQRDEAHQTPSDSDALKAMKKAVLRYHNQLLVGCGRAWCPNENCASSGKLKKMTSNEAAAQALRCLRSNAQMCEPIPDSSEEIDETKIMQLVDSCEKASDWSEMRTCLELMLSSRAALTNAFCNKNFVLPADNDTFITHLDAMDICEQPNCSVRKRRAETETQQDEGDGSIVQADNSKELSDRKHAKSEKIGTSKSLISNIQTCSSDTCMNTLASQASTHSRSDSNLNSNKNDIEASTECESKNKTDVEDKTKSLKKKAVPALTLLKQGKSPTDVEAVRRCVKLLFENPQYHEYLNPAMDAVAHLCKVMHFQLQYEKAWEHDPCGVVHILTILFELPFVQWPEFIEVGFNPLCKMCANLCKEAQLILSIVWAEFGSQWIHDRINLMQQAITLRVLTLIDTVGTLPRFTDRDEPLPTTIQTLSIFYQAMLIRSKKDMKTLGINSEIMNEKSEMQLISESDESMNAMESGNQDSQNLSVRKRFSTFLEAFTNHANATEIDEEEEVRMAMEAPIDSWMVTSTCIPLTESTNETLSENVLVEDDYIAYKLQSYERSRAFSIMPEYSFLLSTEVKQNFLYLNNKIRQRSERRQALADAITFGFTMEPYLRLTVRRDHVVRDALDGLAVVAFDNAANFKKQLRIHFDGEHAVDEGGVSKEFYQLIMDELFCPDYGMFVANNQTGLYWFNPQCTFCDDEYGLIGLLFGLAIYNNILIDVRFPTLLYVKLLARPAVFDELIQIDPDLYSGLNQLLECEDDVESIYNYTFQISYKDVYGNNHDEELITNGKSLSVTNSNKKKFVALYADYLLNRSIHRQFNAFSLGFNRVANRGLLRRLFNPTEVEQLVCGVLDLDFDVLSNCTKYRSGFTESSQTVKDFWTVAKAMDFNEKKMLLQFITGSDRAPVGGLAKLEVVIARNGDDKERLPTAHTCYNVMLLPDYNDLEITRERLTKAITYSRGFGLQ